MQDRVRYLNPHPVRLPARYVLYWAQMNRRVEGNHGLAYAVTLANQHDLPVLYYEGLTCSYPQANDRLHTFILEGVPETAGRLRALGIGYAFYLRRRHDQPDDILYRLAEDAAAVVTDDYPTFVARAHNTSVPGKLAIPYAVVDSSCVVPMNRLEKREYAAYTIRPKIHRLLAECLKPVEIPKPRRPYREASPDWHTEVAPGRAAHLAASCQIDHSVPPSITYRGGREAARRHLACFLERKLRRYAGERNQPGAHATSNLSPYLHFGNLSAIEIALAVRAHAARHKLMADEFLEELIVRRELAFNYARHAGRPDSLENLPEWARESLRRHAADPRPYQYTPEQFEQAATHDALWNATQKEMRLRGTIHGYYRMYWGKKIIEWSPTYQQALDTMLAIHDRWALDGRDPNTYANILWCFGLHDRPWGRRPVFGTLRYMSLEGMKRKTGVEGYIREIELVERSGKDPFRVE